MRSFLIKFNHHTVSTTKTMLRLASDYRLKISEGDGRLVPIITFIQKIFLTSFYYQVRLQ